MGRWAFRNREKLFHCTRKLNWIGRFSLFGVKTIKASKMRLTKNAFTAMIILLVCILSHYLLMEWVFKIHKPYFISIYVFTFLVLMITMTVIELLEKKYREFLGYIFLIIVVLKLFSAKLFMNSFVNWRENEFKFSFLVLYLISLILITWFVAKKLLKEKDDEKQKNRFR